jgi:tRNA A-37 threonylcarbamoyl transferase component Bud32/predicted esterase
VIAPGTRLGAYEIVALLGTGGMGEVYRARHLKLRRDVAIKVLPQALAADPAHRERFEREARAASALNHPAIITIHDIGDHEGTPYIAMEVVEGKTLRACLNDGRLGAAATVAIARQIAHGLASAHAAGIVHRDLKPDNVMVTPDGRAKILDFGLAKHEVVPADANADTAAVSRFTGCGVVLGTLPYLSPEQAAGRTISPASDQFSLGVVLYEMLSGERPFKGDSGIAVLSAILRDAPTPLPAVVPGTPKHLAEVVDRCLRKEPGHRYPSTWMLCEALDRSGERLATAASRRAIRRPLAVAALMLAVFTGGAAWLWMRGANARWAGREAIPAITRLTEAGELYEAYRLVRQAMAYLPAHPELPKMRDRITLPISIVTEPAGADVFVQGYATPGAAWEHLGTTPLNGIRIPYALMRWRITKEGYEPFEGAPFGEAPFAAMATGFGLDLVGTRPPGMVRVPGGPIARPEFPAVSVDAFWLDRYEVTNRQFKQFVEAGGYRNRGYWRHLFEVDRRVLSLEEASTLLRDATGRPGPSTWELGTYAEGRENDPVGGVSWFEAAAYCEFVGGQLPTVYHWYKATVQDQFSDIVRFSNFGGTGPGAVGSHGGLGDYGTYDMAGNVKEWTFNATGARRYILGGAWNEPTYMYRLDPDAQLPFERRATYGFRCARFPTAPDARLVASIQPANQVDESPVDDEVFAAYRRLYAYDKTSLSPVIDAVDDRAPGWRRETVSYRGAYGAERVVAQLLLPRDAAPPYQAVVWFPGNDAFFGVSSETPASEYLFDFVPKSGRALVHPVYKGMYERRVAFSRDGNEWRDMVITWSKDLSRALDYLETRADIDSRKVAFYGFSLGAQYGPVFTAVDGRFGASVLLAGGLRDAGPPEIAARHFAPRSRTPTVMISGRDDFIRPQESSQRPLFRLLGVAESDKRHALLEGGHIPSDRRAIVREVLDWLDRYLGPVSGAR